MNQTTTNRSLSNAGMLLIAFAYCVADRASGAEQAPMPRVVYTCICGPSCNCAVGDCPSKCPILSVKVDARTWVAVDGTSSEKFVQICQNGTCRRFSQANPIRVRDLPDGGTPTTPKPKGERWVWKFLPGKGTGWVQDGGDEWLWGGTPEGKWGWVRSLKK